MKNEITAVLIGSLMVVLALPACAEEINIDATIEYRQHVMKSSVGHLKAISFILKSGLPLKGHLIDHARALAANATMTVAGFPEGSDFGGVDTAAKAKIWDEWDTFKQKSKNNIQATERLVKAVSGGQASTVMAAFKEVGKSCKGCHKPFREKR